jgi:hypothetical protein
VYEVVVMVVSVRVVEFMMKGISDLQGKDFSFSPYLLALWCVCVVGGVTLAFSF